MSTAEKIKNSRLKRGLTQKQLSEMAHITQQSISQYESGARLPKIDSLERIASALNVPVEFLRDEKDYIPTVTASQINNLAKLIYGDQLPLIEAYDLLNREGKKVAVARVRELTEIPRYRNTYTDGPETAPADDD